MTERVREKNKQSGEQKARDTYGGCKTVRQTEEGKETARQDYESVAKSP